MMMKYNILIATAMAGTLLAGCASDDGQLSNNGTPRIAEFSGQLSAISTRSDASNTSDASANTAWPETYESIGISATSSGTSCINQQYVATATKNGATLSVTNDGNAFYFNTTKSTESFVAYAPYTENVTNNTIAIEPLTADNAASYGYTANDADGISTPDYIWAKTGTLTYAHNTADLTFTHVLSQLTLTVTLDESVTTRNTDGTYTVTLAGVELSHLVKTGTLSLVDGTVTPSTSYGIADVTPSADETSTAGIITTKLGAYALIPQEGIVVTVTTSVGSSYQATLPALTAGTSYAYTLTVKNTGLTISPTITPWETTTGTVTAQKAMLGDFSDPAETYLYDLAFSDGSYIHVADEEGNLPSDLTIELTEEQKNGLRGIVYYKGDITDDDSMLKEDYPNCTHGSIVALKYAATSQEWMTEEIPIFDYQDTSETLKKYESIMVKSTSSDVLSKCLGYNNTQIIKAYNSGNVTKVLPMVSIEEYGVTDPAPSNSSGWLFPSVGDLKQLNSSYSNVATILEKLDYSTTIEKQWASTEKSESQAYFHYFYSYQYTSYILKTSYCNVRAICAY